MQVPNSSMSKAQLFRFGVASAAAQNMFGEDWMSWTTLSDIWAQLETATPSRINALLGQLEEALEELY